MTKRRNRRRKDVRRAARKPSQKKQAAKKPPPGIGHNQPEQVPPPSVPDIRTWYTDDHSMAVIARSHAARQMRSVAAMSSMSVGWLPQAPSSPSLHEQMLKRVAALEEVLASPAVQASLDEKEAAELKAEIARLKQRGLSRTDAAGVESKLRKFAEAVVMSLAVDQAKKALAEAAQALADAISAWIGSL
jgi:hypothetical protein